MTDTERIAIVVGTNRPNALLRRCLESLQPLAEQPRDLILVDNGSKGSVTDWAGRHFPLASVVTLEQNRLYCGGYNAGIQNAIDHGYDYVLILNADTEVVNPQLLPQLRESARRWPRAAFLGPRVFFRSRDVVQNTCLRFPSLFRSVFIWLPWRIAPGTFLTQPKEETEVEFLNGVCMLCRVSALREFGLMDDRFGGYVEDADWSWRARQRGWLSVFTPIPSIIHHEDIVGYEPYSLKTFLLKRNTVFWYLKVGWRGSAHAYAISSMNLARIKLLCERSETDRRKYHYFIQKLSRAYKGLLRDEGLGEWIGPPLGSWDQDVVLSSWL